MAAVNLRIAPHVARALDRGGAVVALESTVLTHGLPRPRNEALAAELHATVEAAGAVPATIGILDGCIHVGLDDAQVARLARGEADKASPWNLAAIATRGGDAGTTVATTLYAASRAGIRVFATGGIGGVHVEPFDESADLRALAHHPVVTVCAGPKSILDASATLERLESYGVPVVGYRCDHLAGFFVPETDLPVPARADDEDTVARIARTHFDSGLTGAVLVGKPVSAGLDRAELDRYLEAARADARDAGVRGKAATPYLLERLAQRSDGRTVEVNVRLLTENADLAAGIATAMTPEPEGMRT